MKTRTAIVAIAAATVISGTAAGTAVMLASNGQPAATATSAQAQRQSTQQQHTPATPAPAYPDTDTVPTQVSDNNSHPAPSRHSYPKGTTPDVTGAAVTVNSILDAFRNDSFADACDLMDYQARTKAYAMDMSDPCPTQLAVAFRDFGPAERQRLADLQVKPGHIQLDTGELRDPDVPSIHLNGDDFTDPTVFKGITFSVLYQNGQWLVDYAAIPTFGAN